MLGIEFWGTYMINFRHRIIVFCSLILISIIAEGQQKRQIRQENKAFDRALDYAESEDYEKAIASLKQIVVNSPDFIDAHYQLGLCYLNTNKGADTAIVVLQEGLMKLSANEQSTQKGWDFFIALGKAYQVTLQPDSAIMVYDELLLRLPIEEEEYIRSIEHEIQNCENAKVFLANPIDLTITNLGKKVNSRFDDHSPLVNAYEDLLLFTSRRKQNKLPLLTDGQYPEKVYYTKGDSSRWNKARLLNVFFKNPEHESALSLSHDGKSLFLFRSDHAGSNIYISYLESEGWTTPIKLPYPINSSANETHASLSSDRSTLFFTSDREGGHGGIDIYMCKKDAYGQWGTARNLGSRVNTSYDEETAMIHPDGHTLYFASEGHHSMGRMDVFYTQMNNDSTWTFPVNLGYPINTPDDDFFFLPTLDKSHAYYASARFNDNMGGSDIYRVDFDEDFSGELAIIEGEVEDGDYIKGTTRIMVTRMTDRQLVGDYRPDHRTGKYTMFLETGHDYAIKEQQLNKTVDESVLSVKPAMAYSKTDKVISFDEVKMTPPLKRLIKQLTLEEQNEQVIAEIEEEIKHIDFAPFYTIQVLALKRRPLFASHYLKGLDIKALQVVKCKDGYTRYLYGAFHSRIEAKERRKEIMKMGKYEDSFVRRLVEITELKED